MYIQPKYNMYVHKCVHIYMHTRTGTAIQNLLSQILHVVSCYQTLEAQLHVVYGYK